MRASDLLSSDVVDAAGRRLGRVRDVHLERDGFRVVGLVVGNGPFAGIAHGWGYVEGRARRPALIAALCRGAIRRTRFVPAEYIHDWGPGIVQLAVDARDVRVFDEEPLR